MHFTRQITKYILLSNKHVADNSNLLWLLQSPQADVKSHWRRTTSQITWCFSDRASWIDYILITNFCALIIIYS